MSREQYRALNRQLRESMRASLAGKRKYAISTDEGQIDEESDASIAEPPRENKGGHPWQTLIEG
jgi:hypothetical protein